MGHWQYHAYVCYHIFVIVTESRSVCLRYGCRNCVKKHSFDPGMDFFNYTEEHLPVYNEI